MGSRSKTRIREITYLAMMTALLLIGKQALSFLPNVEVVSLLIMLYTLSLGRRVLYIIYAFVLMQGALYGFGLWWIMYLYIWTILAGVTWLLRQWEGALVYALVSGIYGLLFGALCTIPYFFVGGVAFAVSWWIAGIPYDIIHCVGNFVLCLVLYRPLRRLFQLLLRPIC